MREWRGPGAGASLRVPLTEGIAGERALLGDPFTEGERLLTTRCWARAEEGYSGGIRGAGGAEGRARGRGRGGSRREGGGCRGEASSSGGVPDAPKQGFKAVFGTENKGLKRRFASKELHITKGLRLCNSPGSCTELARGAVPLNRCLVTFTNVYGACTTGMYADQFFPLSPDPSEAVAPLGSRNSKSKTLKPSVCTAPDDP